MLEAKDANALDAPIDCDDTEKMARLVLEGGVVKMTADGGGMPNEGPENTLSSNNDKYCTYFTEGFSMSWNFNEPILMRGYVIKTANDCPGRDPYDWTVTG